MVSERQDIREHGEPRRFPMKVHAVIFSVMVLMMCVLIFIFSSQDSNESSMTSGRIVTIVSGLLFPDLSQLPADRQYEIIDRVTLVIRKGAHFSEYAVLAQLVFQLFLVLPRPRRKIICAGCAWLFAVIFAATDEYHQSFVPGRAMMAKDVLIDSLGALFGVLIALFIVGRLAKAKQEDNG